MTADELQAALEALRARTEERLASMYHRSLPFADGLFDRWERARRLGFGEDASIYDSALVYGDVHAGAHTWVGPNVLLDGSGGGLTIGEWCSISAGVQIYTHDTVAWALSGGVAAFHRAPVSIGDRCHVGAAAIIAAGVTVGIQCVVGAQAFVNRDVPDRSVVAGVPARVIGTIDGDGADVRILIGDAPRDQ